MKNYTFIAYLYLLIIACSGGREKSGGEDASTESAQPISEVGDAGRQDTTLEPIPFAKDTSNWPAFIKNPTLTTVQLGDTTIVLSRPFIHKNNTAEKDAERIARDQIIKARIEKMTREHPGWYKKFELEPNYRYNVNCFLLYSKGYSKGKDLGAHVYFEKSGRLMSVKEEMAFIYPDKDHINRCGNRACEIKPSKIDQSIQRTIRLNPHLSKNSNIIIEEMFILNPYVSVPSIVSYERTKEVYIEYSKEYLSEEGLIGAQGGMVVYDLYGNKILDYFDKKDKTSYIYLINDSYFASMAMADGSEGCNECLPFVIKIISRVNLHIIYEKVFPRCADVKICYDKLDIAPNQGVENALVYRVINSFHDSIEYHFVDLDLLQEWEYAFKYDRDDPTVWHDHNQIMKRAYKKYSSGDIDSFEKLGYTKINN